MNIAYFLDIPVGLGGAGNLLLNQAAVMQKIHNVVVAIPVNYEGNENPEYALRCDKAGLRHVGLDYRTAYRIPDIDILRVQRDYHTIFSFLQLEQINFVHSVQLNVTVEMASRTLGIPNLMNIYQIDEDEFNLPCQWMLPHYQSSDSELYCELWKNKLDMLSRCMRPVSPVEKCLSVDKKDDITRFAMIGDVCDYKNQLSGIMAFSEILKCGRNAELHVFGYDTLEYASQCKRYVDQNNLSGHIVFHGFVSDVLSEIKDMDAYFCVSLWESFPSSLVESLSIGLSIISTPVAGVPELMKNKENAFISEGYSVKDIVRSLEDYFEAVENGDIHRIHRNARKTWEENFSIDAIRKRLDKYYNDIIEDHKEIGDRDSAPFVSFIENQITVDSNSIFNYVSENPYGNQSMLRRTYYYACMKKSIEEYRSVYIWGCGRYGRFVYGFIKRFTPSIKIKAFVDSYKEGEFEGIRIIRPEEVIADSNEVMIVSTIKDVAELLASCERKGFINNKTLWLVP